MTSRGVSDDFWIEVCVRELAGYWINPLTALEFVSIPRSSTDVDSFVFELFTSSFSGSFWAQLQLLSLTTWIDAHCSPQISSPWFYISKAWGEDTRRNIRTTWFVTNLQLESKVLAAPQECRTSLLSCIMSDQSRVLMAVMPLTCRPGQTGVCYLLIS